MSGPAPLSLWGCAVDHGFALGMLGSGTLKMQSNEVRFDAIHVPDGRAHRSRGVERKINREEVP
jgi:hypothetical protein